MSDHCFCQLQACGVPAGIGEGVAGVLRIFTTQPQFSKKPLEAGMGAYLSAPITDKVCVYFHLYLPAASPAQLLVDCIVLLAAAPQCSGHVWHHLRYVCRNQKKMKTRIFSTVSQRCRDGACPWYAQLCPVIAVFTSPIVRSLA